MREGSAVAIIFTFLQANETEGDTGHEQLNNLPEGGGGEAFFR